MSTAQRTKSKSTKKKGPKDLDRLAEMMAGIDFCMMTTHGAGGAFHTRPMSNNGEVELDADTWFFTSKDTCKVDELERDDRVSLAFTGGSKKAPVWIAVTGTAKLVEDVEKKKELWVAELEQWFENGPEDPDVVLIRVRAERAQYWSYEDQGEVVISRRRPTSTRRAGAARRPSRTGRSGSRRRGSRSAASA
jgi:general stress protein 26